MATGKIKFGTDGFRGIIADDFTFENVEKITCGIIKYLKDFVQDRKSVLIAYDPRFMADEFAKFSSEIFLKAGYNVMLSNSVCPTPVVAYAATVAKSSAGAVMFTASHNPKNYLGMKFIPNYGGPATKEITDEIVKNIEENYYPSSQYGAELINSDISRLRGTICLSYRLRRKRHGGLTAKKWSFLSSGSTCHKLWHNAKIDQFPQHLIRTGQG